MRVWAFLFALVATPATMPALAQAPARIDGTIIEFEPARFGQSMFQVPQDRMEVRAQGALVTVIVPAEARISALRQRTLDSIKPGDFVGSTAVPGPDGKLHAQEVHIFPESLRGSGEGHRPMGQPQQTMTNATVDGVVAGSGGRILRLRYPGGEQSIEVGPDVPVVEFVPGDRSFLVPGAAVAVRGTEGPGAAVTASSIQVERNGVKPLP